MAAKLLEWYSENARDLPWRRTKDPYWVFVSEIMLQQTQVKTVIPYWERWMRELPSLEAAAQADPARIHKLWEGLGYYTRVRNLQKAAQQIVERHAGRFPQDFDEVLALPGIGRYTAGAICSIAFNQPKPILDGNVIRVLTRVFGIGGNPRDKETNGRLWQLAEELVGHASRLTFHVSRFKSKTRTRTKDEDEMPACSHLNQALMELGALVCTPRQPECPVCPVKKLCVAFRDNRVEELPNLGKRAASTARRFAAFVAERQGRFLVRQRPAGVVNAHLWEFPNVEIGPRVSRPAALPHAIGRRNFPVDVPPSGMLRLGEPRSGSVAEMAAQALGFAPRELTPLCTLKHSITRYRITLEVFRIGIGRAGATRSKTSGVWLPLTKLDSLALTGAHRKILERLKSKLAPPADTAAT